MANFQPPAKKARFDQTRAPPTEWITPEKRLDASLLSVAAFKTDDPSSGAIFYVNLNNGRVSVGIRATSAFGLGHYDDRKRGYTWCGSNFETIPDKAALIFNLDLTPAALPNHADHVSCLATYNDVRAMERFARDEYVKMQPVTMRDKTSADLSANFRSSIRNTIEDYTRAPTFTGRDGKEHDQFITLCVHVYRRRNNNDTSKDSGARPVEKLNYSTPGAPVELFYEVYDTTTKQQLPTTMAARAKTPGRWCVTLGAFKYMKSQRLYSLPLVLNRVEVDANALSAGGSGGYCGMSDVPDF